MQANAKISPGESHAEDGASGGGEAVTPVVKNATIKQMFQYADGQDYILMAIGSIHAFVAGLGMPGSIILFGRMFDAFGDPSQAEDGAFLASVEELALLLVYLGLALWYCIFVASVCWARVGDRQGARVRAEYIRAVLRQEIGWFDQNKVTELPTKIIKATEQIQSGLGRTVGQGVQYMSSFLGMYATGFLYSWKLSLVIMAGFPFMTAAAMWMQNALKEFNAAQTAAYAGAGARAAEALGAPRTVYALNGQAREAARFSEQLAPAERAGNVGSLKMGLAAGLTFGIMFSLYAVGFGAGGEFIARGIEAGCLTSPSAFAGQRCLTGGDVIIVMFAIMFGGFCLAQASPAFEGWATAKQAASEVFATVERVPEIDAESTEGQRPASTQGALSLRGVHFAYPTRPGNPVYRGLELEVAPGESVALVGPSGEGKSTLIALVLRFYDPREGAVCLDGQDIRGLNLKWYRSKIGYVGQEPVLFAGTVRTNVRSGRPGATDAEVQQAAEAANAHGFIQAFPQGYETDVGEAGVQLSGGQKQRIAIARALIKAPKILLLDEATSALDNESERVVQEALDRIQAASAFTTLVVAHRLTTVQNCDRIAVISGGQVKEIGPHKELLAKGGIYASLASHGATAQTTDKVESIEKTASLGPGDEQEEKIEKASPARRKSASLSLGRRLSASLGGKQVSPAGGDVEDGKGKGEVKVGYGRLLGLAPGGARGYLVLGLASSLLCGGSFPLQGFLIAKAQNSLYSFDADEVRRDSAKWAYFYAGYSALIFLAQALMKWGLGANGAAVTRAARERYFQAFLARTISWFDRKENAPGALIEWLEKDAALIQLSLGGVLGATANACSALLVGFGMAMFYSWQMSLATLGTIIPMSIGGVIEMQAAQGVMMDSNKAQEGGEAGATVASAVVGVRTVHAFGMNEAVLGDYRVILEKKMKSDARKSSIAGIALGYSQGVPMFVYAFLFWLGAYLVNQGGLNFEDMLAALFCLISVSFSMGDAAGLAGDQAAAKKAVARCFGLLDLAEEREPAGGEGARPAECAGALEFADLKFAYPERPDAQVYDGFSLSVGAGQTVALCGPSGGGKSTCMALLLGFYRPLAGSITLDGRDVRDLDLRWLRAQIGYVGQEPVLFAGTIRENVVYGAGGAPVGDAELDAAAGAARALDFVKGFPRGWETDVGEKSSLLSGGQKQRLAIARAILKSPKILLLDEATSALDNENEKLVQAALDDLQRGGRFTTLVIAHRLSTIQGANSIAVVSGGQVKQLGTHEALMKEESGLYRQLVQAAERGGGGGNKAKAAATAMAADGEEASPSPKG